MLGGDFIKFKTVPCKCSQCERVLNEGTVCYDVDDSGEYLCESCMEDYVEGLKDSWMRIAEDWEVLE